MIGNTLAHDGTADDARSHRLHVNRRGDTLDRDAAEFSSDAMPGAYGALYSAVIGLAIMGAVALLFWR